MENNLDLLRLPKKEITLGGKKIIYDEMPAGKAMVAVEKYQKTTAILTSKVSDENAMSKILSSVKIMKKYQSEVVKLCLFIIKPVLSFRTLGEYLKYKWLTKKWLYVNTTVKQLQAFIKITLLPIVGDDAVKKMEAIEKALNG